MPLAESPLVGPLRSPTKCAFCVRRKAWLSGMAKCLKFCPSYPTSFRYGGIVARSTLPTEAWTSRLCCASSGTWPSHQCPNPFVIHCVWVCSRRSCGFQWVSVFCVFGVCVSAWVSRSGCCTQAALPDELQRASFVGFGLFSFGPMALSLAPGRAPYGTGRDRANVIDFLREMSVRTLPRTPRGKGGQETKKNIN